MSFRSRTIGSFRSDFLRPAASPPSSCSRLFTGWPSRIGCGFRADEPASRRLGLVDAFSLDGQRQLVLIRRDNIEHLVMIGGPNDVLVELQINRAVTPARESAQASPSARADHAGAQDRSGGAACVAASRSAGEGRRQGSSFSTRAPAPAAAVTAAPAAPTAAPSIPKAPVPAQPSPPAPVQPTAPVPASAPDPARPSFRCVGADATVGAGPAGGRNAAATSGGAASRASAGDNAPADHPRQRLPEPWSARPRDGNGVRERADQSSNPLPAPSSPVAPAPTRRQEKAEPAVADAKTEAAVTTAKTEPRAASAGTVAPRPARLWLRHGLRQRHRVRTGVRLGAKSSRRPPGRRQSERRADRQAAESRRSLR